MASIVLLSFLRQKARQLKNEKSLSWHKALDEAAKELGYSNYKNYQNLLEANRKQSKSPIEILLENISSEDNMSKKMNLAISFIKNNLIPFTDLVYILKPFQHSVNLKTVCEKANLKDDIRSCIFNDFLSDEGKREIVSFYERYRMKEISLGKICYEMNENVICIDGLYELKVEFDSETADHDFIDRSLFGTFEMVIDSKDIAMKYDLGHNFEDMCPAGSKNYFNYYSQ